MKTIFKVISINAGSFTDDNKETIEYGSITSLGDFAESDTVIGVSTLRIKFKIKDNPKYNDTVANIRKRLSALKGSKNISVDVECYCTLVSSKDSNGRDTNTILIVSAL